MRRIKGFFAVIIVLVVLAGAGFGLLRMARTKVSEATAVKPNLFEVANAGGIYVFAAKVGPHVIMFDTGLDPEARPVDVVVGALGAGRGDVTDVFLTHGHMDHTAGASRLPNAKLHLGAGDVPLAEGKAQPEGLVPRLLNLVVPAPPLTISDPMNGAASFDVGGGATVKAFPVPGHTPGSFAFLYDGVLFVGDIAVLKQGQLEPPPGVFDPHPEENRAAIRALRTQLASETVDVVCTSHGGCTPKGLGKSLLDELASRI
jgi:glyoxylase-like metal-dependent hydrolase (beta-lactamase superfamily II)